MWENGLRQGEGTMTYNTGESYSGEYVQSLADGKGKYTFINGDVYEGSFRGGKMHGPGVYKYHTGDTYYGYMRNGSKCDNHARYAYKSGDVYFGRFHKNYPYGRASLMLKKTRENPNPQPLQLWNGKLIETDPRPSKNGAYTNYVEELDQPIQYMDTDSDSSSSDDDSRATSPSQSIVSRYSAVNDSNQPSRSMSPVLFEDKEYA